MGFRTVGYGHGQSLERLDERAAPGRLRRRLSIEHEDSLMSVNEGLTKAVRFLQRELLEERRAVAFSA